MIPQADYCGHHSALLIIDEVWFEPTTRLETSLFFRRSVTTAGEAVA